MRKSERPDETHTLRALGKLHDNTLMILDGVRRRSLDLHPVTLKLLGLGSALKSHCLEVEKQHSVSVTFEVVGDIGNLDQEVGVCLFRIAQEALRNAVVHGHSRRLRVCLSRSDERIELAVLDDGQGFDAESARESGRGLGLVSMEERARLVNGEVLIVSSPGQGTAVLARVPVREQTKEIAWRPAQTVSHDPMTT
jgi:two-component system sensor histidine kinase UhpB